MNSYIMALVDTSTPTSHVTSTCNFKITNIPVLRVMPCPVRHKRMHGRRPRSHGYYPHGNVARCLIGTCFFTTSQSVLLTRLQYASAPHLSIELGNVKLVLRTPDIVCWLLSQPAHAAHKANGETKVSMYVQK